MVFPPSPCTVESLVDELVGRIPAHAHLVVPIANGEPVHLTKTEFKLLVELADQPGVVLSREDLLERVWGHGVFGDGRLVDVHIRRLRTKIENDPANPTHVVTVRGLGYKLQG